MMTPTKRVPTLLGFLLLCTVAHLSVASSLAVTATASVAEERCPPDVLAVVPTDAKAPTEEELNNAANSLAELATELGDSITYDFTNEAPLTEYDYFAEGPAYTMVLDHESPIDPERVVQSVIKADLPVEVSILRSCSSHQALWAVLQKVTEVEEPKDFEGMSLRVSDALGVVSIGVSDATFAERLRTLFGGSVQVDKASLMLTDRAADDAPHYGGARIWPGSCIGQSPHWCAVNKGWCSSGITMRANGSGNVFQTTAGHCYPPTWNIWSGGSNTLPRYPLGQVFVNHANDNPTPGYNTDILGYDGDTSFKNALYADPSGYSRTVTGGSNANVGTFVCQSGAVSGFTCGIQVEDANMVIDGVPTTWFGLRNFNHLSMGLRSDFGLISAKGDSGGPVFHGNDESTVTMRGSVSFGGAWLGHDCGTVNAYGETLGSCPALYWTNVEQIENILNAQVATSYP